VFELLPGRVVLVGGVVIVIVLILMIATGRNRRAGETITIEPEP
jgi:hypothetical protein